MESNGEKNKTNNNNTNGLENSTEEKDMTQFNFSYILIKIDDYIAKKKYSKIVKEITKIEKENKEILFKKYNIKFYVNLFEIKILSLCHLIEGKISDLYTYQKNTLVFNSKLENMISLEKSFEKLKKILEEGMSKLKIYMNEKSVITENMKEHIILSYARAIFLQGKFCKLKKQVADAAAFFNIGINLLKRNIKKSIESETFSLFAQFLLSLSVILIEDNAYYTACENIDMAINYFIRVLFLTIENENGINIDSINTKSKSNPCINSIKGLIISLFLLGVCLEKIDRLENAITLYGQSYWLSKKFFQNIDPIFFNLIQNIFSRVNEFKEDLIREIKNKFIEEKQRQKLRAIQERNLAKAMKLSNIVNRGCFNIEKYLKMENRLKNVLDDVENKYGNKKEKGKKYLPIIKYLNTKKNKFNFTFDYLMKEKEKQMEKKLKEKNSKYTIAKTESNCNTDTIYNTFNTESTNKYLITYNDEKSPKFNSFDYNEHNTEQKNNGFRNSKFSSFKDKMKKKLFKIRNSKLINGDSKKREEYFSIKSNSNSNTNTYTNPNVSNFAKSKSQSVKVNLPKYSFNTTTSCQNNLEFRTLKVKDESIQQKFFSNFEKYIKIKECSVNSDKRTKNRQKGFITKNSFVFCRGFKKGIQYLEKMDKREMKFQKQLLNLRGIKEDYNDEIETINNYNSGLYKDKVKEEAKFVYMKIKDKIDDKLNINNNIDLKSADIKSKKIDKILMQKIKLENSLIVGLNDLKIDELKKLDKDLKEVKQNQIIGILNPKNFGGQKKSLDKNEEKMMSEIKLTNKKNNEVLGNLNNEILKFNEKTMNFNKRKLKGFSLSLNLKRFRFQD